jgi:hypothetical protein
VIPPSPNGPSYYCSGLTVGPGVTVLGWGGVLKMKPGSLDLITTWKSSSGAAPSDISLLGLRIDGNGAASGWPAKGVSPYPGRPLALQGTNIVASGCRIANTYSDAIAIQSTNAIQSVTNPNPFPTHHVTVTDCVLTNIGDTAIDVGAGDTTIGCAGVLITNNEIITTGQHGVWVFALTASVVGNVVDGTGLDGISGYNANPDGSNASARVLVDGNNVTNCGNHGIHIGGTDVAISGNVVKSVLAHGIFIYAAQDSKHVSVTLPGYSITGNTLDGTTGDGIRINSEFVGVVANNAIYWPNGNGITLADNATGETPPLKAPPAQQVSITANAINGPGSCGIFLDVGSNVLAVADNMIRSPTSTGIVATSCSAVTCTGNTVYASVNSDGIQLNHIDTGTVAGNVSINNAGNGLTIAGCDCLAVNGNSFCRSTGWGISCDAATTQVAAVGNVVVGNHAGQISSLGGSTSLAANNVLA